MPNPILTYYLKHKNLVLENLVKCEDPEDIEAIHDMRLSIKRMRVVAKLADQVSKNKFNSKESLAELNKFFKKSGRLRDIQVTKSLLVDLNDNALGPIIEQFNKREKKQRTKFDKTLSSFRVEVLDEIELKLSTLLDGISEKRSFQAGHALFLVYQDEIQQIFHKNDREKRMHDIRTKLKDINYLNNIFEDKIPIQDYLNISVERLKELGEMAGSWHDCYNLISILNKYARKHHEDEHVPSIATSIKEIQIKKEGLYQDYKCILLNEMKI